MDDKKRIKTMKVVILILLLVNLLATAGLAGWIYFSHPSQPETALDYQEVEKYTLYVGTSDKNGNAIYSLEEAKQIVNPICDKYVPGYTVFEASGHWTTENGVLIDENTLVYVFYRTDEEHIIAIMNDVLKELHQSAVLVEKENVGYVFYDGRS
ncbi:DUF3574 domain-containing protein [Methanolapillus ohkumae]|uniref:DUF3574 domain-containing protein n=1 Tax=Methanolapillus ohkumae TaxID=3028298 RepID=A0AA96V8L7_9EURY|nr:hypothetical protein MsAm2_16190 [Methanosarcinaceae archaeon Am2]